MDLVRFGAEGLQFYSSQQQEATKEYYVKADFQKVFKTFHNILSYFHVALVLLSADGPAPAPGLTP